MSTNNTTSTTSTNNTNLLEETLEDIKEAEHKIREIEFVGSLEAEVKISWSKFRSLAKETNYDGGYGSVEVISDLIIVFNDGCQLVRHEYDGSECWQHIPSPAHRPEGESKTLKESCYKSYKVTRLSYGEDDSYGRNLADANNSAKLQVT